MSGQQAVQVGRADVGDILREVGKEGGRKVQGQLTRVGDCQLLEAVVCSPTRLRIHVSICIGADRIAKAENSIHGGGETTT